MYIDNVLNKAVTPRKDTLFATLFVTIVTFDAKVPPLSALSRVMDDLSIYE